MDSDRQAEILRRRAEILRRVQFLTYSKKLEHLTGFTHKLDDLTSPEFVKESAAKFYSNPNLAPPVRREVLFEERLSDRFKALIADLESRNPSPIYIWIQPTSDCGYAKPIKLSEFRFGFEFEAIPEGLITLITSDNKEHFMMDFEENNKGIKTLILELQGANWGRVDLGQYGFSSCT